MSKANEVTSPSEQSERVKRLVIQRFKPALTDGYWPNNPEPLVRDPLGEYVKVSDVVDLIEKAHMAGQWRNGDGVDPSYYDALEYRKTTLDV
jgi:hypothetical protein